MGCIGQTSMRICPFAVLLRATTANFRKSRNPEEIGSFTGVHFGRHRLGWDCWTSFMSTVQEIQAAIRRLSPGELAELKEWMEDFFEDQLELKEEVKTVLDQSRAE